MLELEVSTLKARKLLSTACSGYLASVVSTDKANGHNHYRANVWNYIWWDSLIFSNQWRTNLALGVIIAPILELR